MLDEKAQMHTLEGVAAATIMLLVIVYAMDATTLTPVSSSTASVHMVTELQTLGQDILSALDYAEPGYNSKLKNDIMTWDGTEYTWNGTKYVDSGNATNILPNNLTQILNASLVSRGIAHNVEINFLRDNGTSLDHDNWKMIYNGDPSNNAVIISRKIVLQNSDFNPDANYPVEDIDFSTNLFNIVDVKLILWRT